MRRGFIAALAGGVLVIATGMAAAGSAGNLTLASAGTANYTIVLSEKASPSERHGAQELASFLKEMSGATFSIAVETSNYHVPDRAILIGRGRTVDALVGARAFRGLGDDGFLIRAVGDRLVLAGGRQRGTMYACYSLLEHDLGCRWYSSKVSVIPYHRTLRVPANLSRREVPAFEYREPFYTDAFDADWAARNRSNGNGENLDAARGDKLAYYPFVHSFYSLVPPEKYFKTHPEYFALVDGKRRSSGAQLCLTNPDVLKIATQQVLEWIKEHPDVQIISVSQNDCGGACQCPKCEAVVKREGAQSGPLLEFVNAIAAVVAKKYPGKLIDTLAYQYTKDPPEHIKPAPNVRVRLCPIEACVSHPFEQCEQDKVFVDLLHKWTHLTKNLYVWHYVTNFANYMQPLPNFREIGADIPMYYHAGVKGLFLEGDYATGGNGEFCEMRAWVEAKLLWNPNRKLDDLVNDFLNGYYGKAGPALRKYFDLMHNNVMANHIHAHVYDPPTAPYLTPDILDKAEIDFKEAMDAVRSQPEYLRRVQRDYLSIRYVRLCQVKDAWAQSGRDPKEAQQVWPGIQQFCDDYQSYGAQYISEGSTITAWEGRMKSELGITS